MGVSVEVTLWCDDENCGEWAQESYGTDTKEAMKWFKRGKKEKFFCDKHKYLGKKNDKRTD